MALDIKIGDLVNSKSFNGVGKVLAMRSALGMASIGFFESPLNPEARILDLQVEQLKKIVLFDEAIIYCRDEDYGLWRRARYGGARPEDMHLIMFRKNEHSVVPISEIYVLNLAENNQLRPADFLAACSNDAMYFAPFRERFIRAYVSQRASCRSLSAIPSSSIEIEPHQIAVVRRVLQDPIQKYLLADEVGLGKTIEAGIIIRQHLLDKKHESNVIISVPATLVDQWSKELSLRFHLGDLFDLDNEDIELPLKICSHENLESIIEFHGYPTLIVIDEAHLIAQHAWSMNSKEKDLFKRYAAVCMFAESVLLLSGTPLNGNEKNFLAMLHCLNPDAYSISDDGVIEFMARVSEREHLGGLYSALTVESSNIVIEGILDQLVTLFPHDLNLIGQVDKLRPLVDIFAPEASPERIKTIKSLRRYVGDNYKLHQRMLRNRRENSGLSMLFPGLAGLTIKEWEINPRALTLDEILEEYRSLALENPNSYIGMSEDLYLKWIDDYLVSPLCITLRVNHLLQALSGSLSTIETEVLQQLLETSKQEQDQKDNALIEVLREWLNTNPDGKAVVFCGKKNVSANVFEILEDRLNGIEVEHFTTDETPQFNSLTSKVRVLVCDNRGEDGLNLHGGRRLAVHYGLTRSCSRIEQRLGRLNRYSANLKSVRPVESLIILPERSGLVSRWVSLLDNAVEVFDKTVASLQFVLEEHLDGVWKKTAINGLSEIDKSIVQLTGENGLLSLERKKVKVQEELLAMDEEVSQAVEFAEQMLQADEDAEHQASDMIGWITNVLQFKMSGSVDSLFRFSYRGDGDHGARTMVDVRTFISKCLNGIDMNGANSASTSQMTVSRSEIYGGVEIYPFRFGQPFIDSIWDLMQTDSRGASTAYLRLCKDRSFPELRQCFRLGWLVTAYNSGCTYAEQRIGDEKISPKIIIQWLEEDGRPVDLEFQKFLELPYESNTSFEDKSLKPDVWKAINTLISPEAWKRNVLAVEVHGRNLVLQSLSGEIDNSQTPHIQLISIHATLLVSPDTSSELRN
jgi:ATP-dependent helicase HepA